MNVHPDSNGKWKWLVPSLLAIVVAGVGASFTQTQVTAKALADFKALQVPSTAVDEIKVRLDRIDERLRTMEVGQGRIEERIENLRK